MSKLRFYHDCFEYVEGHDDEIHEEKIGNDYKYFILVSGKMEVCPVCHGHGTTFRRDLDESRLVEDMWLDNDYDGLESYHRGAFDERCPECDGKNVVMVPTNLPDWAAKEVDDWEFSRRQDKAEAEAERRALGYY